jgi:hypothetical protein
LWIGDFLRSVVYLPFEQSNGKADVGGVGGNDTPMDKIHQVEYTREEFLLDPRRSPESVLGGCSPRLWRPKSKPTSRRPGKSANEPGRALVVRNGHARKREVVWGAGAVEVRAPRVSECRLDQNGNRRRFKSVILPSYMRRSPKVSELLPLLYLHGLSSGDFVPALEEFFGSGAGLSQKSITRLTERWLEERESFMRRDL